MKVENIKFKNGDALLTGKVFLPLDFSQAKGFIIFTHGLGYCAKTYRLDNKLFANTGYIFCMYNVRGHVGSTGEFATNKAAEDISVIIDTLLDRYKIENKEMIAMLSHSTGGLISLLASINDKRIKCGGVISVVTSMADSFLHWFDSGYIEKVRDNYRHDGKINPGIEKFLLSKESLNSFKNGIPSKEELSFRDKYGLLRLPSVYNFFYEITYSPDIFNYADRIKIPLILFKGKKDEVIPITKTDKLYSLLNCKKRLVETNAIDHFFNNYWPAVEKETLNFFDEIQKSVL